MAGGGAARASAASGCGGRVGCVRVCVRVCVRSKRMNDDDVGVPRLMSV